MLIIAHRGNVNGPGTIDLKECVERNWGVELDLRWDQGKAYFNHEPWGCERKTNAKATFAALKNQIIAVNIKEANHVAETIKLVRSNPRAFVFDMELVGIDPELYTMANCAIRISDRKGESDPDRFPAGIIWLDEFKPWVKEIDVFDLMGFKEIYWVSPELHRPITTTQEFSAMEARWEQMYDWGVDGICTDYPKILASRMEEWGTPQDPDYRASQLSEAPIG